MVIRKKCREWIEKYKKKILKNKEKSNGIKEKYN